MKLKVCGMREAENIEGLIELKPDFIGFIFYPKSARFAGELDEDLMARIPLSIKKVGVFVNEDIENVITLCKKYGLTYAQLHGDEDLDYAMELKAKGIKVIKVFRVMDTVPVAATKYEGIADYLLFDTATISYGGSGQHFDWNILKNQNIKTPFLLSGGVQLEDLEKIKALNLSALAGIDVNSRFEVEPGLKDLELLRALKDEL